MFLHKFFLIITLYEITFIRNHFNWNFWLHTYRDWQIAVTQTIFIFNG